MGSNSIKCISLYSWKDTVIKGQEYKHKNDHIAEMGQSKLIPLLALVTMVGVVYFVAGVGVLHFLRPDYNPVNHAVSNYAVGPFGFLMTSAFFVLAVSMMALAADLYFSIALNQLSQLAILLLCMSSCGIVVMAIFPGDAHALHPPVTTTGIIHWTAAAFSFLCIMVAAFLLASSFKTDKRFQQFQQSCLLLAEAMIGALLLYGVLALLGWVGIGQRIYLAVCLLWLLLLSAWTWSTDRKQVLD